MIMLQDGIDSNLTVRSTRHTLMRFVYGFAAVFLICASYGFARWREIREAREDSRIMREITPDQLIERCGKPQADETNSVPVLLDSGPRMLPFERTLRYRVTDGMVRLSFISGNDHRWHLQFFDSPTVAVRADAENAYIAVPQFPCMRLPPELSIQRFLKRR